MSILLTGSNGFLGKQIFKHFSTNNRIISLGSRNRKMNNYIQADLTKSIPELPQVKINLVIHAAGKAHFVPKTAKENKVFYEENVAITKNLLSALNTVRIKPDFFVFISSVAVYGLEEGELLEENTPLLALDSYGKSKIESEKLIVDWCEQNHVILTILRLPLIAGSDPPGNLGSMMEAIRRGRFPIIGAGNAQRSMVVVNDVPIFIDKIKSIGGIYHLTDGYNPSFKELSMVLNNGKLVLSLPYFMAKTLALLGDLSYFILKANMPIDSKKLSKMINSLTFSNTKAVTTVDWEPTRVLSYFQNQISHSK